MNERQAKILLALLRTTEDVLRCQSLSEWTGDESLAEIEDDKGEIRELIALIEEVSR